VTAQPVVLASGNSAKLREMARLLVGARIELVPQSAFSLPGVEETGLTFIENAILKARHAATGSGLAAIGDDSGLEVDFLGGRPGIRSSRFAGVHATDGDNVNKLLEELAGVSGAARSARFRCVVVYLRHATDPAPAIAQGTWNGRILETPAGRGGFGYDPVFEVPGHACSAAELAPDLKDLLSHRGQALRRLRAALSDRADG